MTETIPLFPLHTVLFPGGRLPLKIFEPRYLEMVSKCLQTKHGFGVCLIQTGSEVGQAAQHFMVGTYACITDWEQRPDGLLGITAKGERRFEVIYSSNGDNNLLEGQIEWLDEDQATTVAEEFISLQKWFINLIEKSGHPCLDEIGRVDDASWLSNRLAELLPLDSWTKQQLLESKDPVERLTRIKSFMQETCHPT